MKIIVTGSNGFIASHIVKHLLDHTSYEIIATSKSEDKLKWESAYPLYSFLKWDIEEKNDLDEVRLQQPNIIIHCAAMGSADECELNKTLALNVNFKSTKNIAELAIQLKAKLIFLSTDFVFSGMDGRPYVENDILAPVNYYGTTKMLAENFISKQCKDSCIVRLCAVYGNAFKGKARGIITLTRERLSENKSINVVGDQVRTPTYVEDISGAINSIILLDAKGVYHVSGEEIFSPYQMAVEAAKYFNLDFSLINEVSSLSLKEPAARPVHTGFKIDKAKKDLNFKPTSMFDGIRKMSRN